MSIPFPPAVNPWPPLTGSPSENLINSGVVLPEEVFCGYCLGPCRGPTGNRVIWWRTWGEYFEAQDDRTVRIAYANDQGVWIIAECIACRLWSQYYEARSVYNTIDCQEVRATLRSLGRAMPIPPDRPW